MDINFELYKMFDRVVKTGSFTKAAEELFISQSAVTQGIRRLEDQLGGSLFVRSKSGISLTQAGSELYEFLAHSLATLENAGNIFAEHKELDRGTIRIACGSTYSKLVLDDALVKFTKDYPNIHIIIKNDITSRSLENVSSR